LNAQEGGGLAPDRRIAYFDGLAAEWDACGPDPEQTLHRVTELADLLELRPGEDLLEVGCGTGQLTQWLADRVRPGRVTAVDFAPAMLEQARAKGIDAEFRLADVCRDDLGRGRFDVGLCFHSFPHFRDQAAALSSLSAALRPSGRLIVMHLRSSAELNAFHDSVGGAVAGDHLPVGEAWEPLLTGAGLRTARLIDKPGLFFLRAVPST